jgi:hypothetical protein
MIWVGDVETYSARRKLLHLLREFRRLDEDGFVC